MPARGDRGNASGRASALPAALPPQVRSDPGADYLLRLGDVSSGHAVAAADIRGGEFFRILAPPGRYELDVTSGTVWQAETALFGSDTRHFAPGAPLSFIATGKGRKATSSTCTPDRTSPCGISPSASG